MTWCIFYLSEQWLKSCETHDDSLNQGQVRVRLQRLDEDSQQLFHLRVAHRLADAAKHNDGAWLQRRVVLEREAACQVRPVLAPLTILHLLHTTLTTRHRPAVLLRIHKSAIRWLGRLVVRALDLRLDGREFDSQLPWQILDGCPSLGDYLDWKYRLLSAPK